MKSHHSHSSHGSSFVIIIVIALFAVGFYFYKHGLSGASYAPTNAPQIQYDRNVSVNFTTSTLQSNPFMFYPAQNAITVHPGQYQTVYFYIKNLQDKPEQFRIWPTVSPEFVSEYLARTSDFSVRIIQIEPLQTLKLSSTFFVDTHLPANDKSLTLNYMLSLVDNHGVSRLQ